MTSCLHITGFSVLSHPAILNKFRANFSCQFTAPHFSELWDQQRSPYSQKEETKIFSNIIMPSKSRVSTQIGLNYAFQAQLCMRAGPAMCGPSHSTQGPMPQRGTLPKTHTIAYLLPAQKTQRKAFITHPCPRIVRHVRHFQPSLAVTQLGDLVVRYITSAPQKQGFPQDCRTFILLTWCPASKSVCFPTCNNYHLHYTTFYQLCMEKLKRTPTHEILL